jgi:hypothetical protein
LQHLPTFHESPTPCSHTPSAGGVVLHKSDPRGSWMIEASGTSADLRAIRVTEAKPADKCGAPKEPRRIVVGGDGPTLLENRNESWVSASTNGLEGDIRSFPGGMVLTSRGLFSDGREPNAPPPITGGRP